MRPVATEFMIVIVVALALLVAILAWLWRGNRDPLLYLTPFALIVPPLIAYGSTALGWPGGWVSTRVAVTGCVLLFALFRVLRSDFRWRPVPGLRWVSPYIVLVTLSVLWGVFSVESIVLASDFISWFIPIVIFVCIATTPRSDPETKSAMRVIGAMVLVEALYCTVQSLSLVGDDRFVPGQIAALTHFGQRDLWFGAVRVYGTLPNLGPNALGIDLLLPTTLAVALAATSRGGPRAFWATVALASIAVTIATYSRGAQLGLVLGLLTLPIWFRSRRGALLSVGALVASAFFLAGTPFGYNALQLYSAGRFDPDAQARLDVWHAIFAETPTHPFGHGFDGWLEASRHVITIGDPMTPVGAPHPADNLWIRELADRGLPGVVALAFLVGGVVVMTYRACGRGAVLGYQRALLAGVGSGVLGCSVAFISGDHLMYLEIAGLFWYFLGLALPIADDALRRPAGPLDPGFLGEARARSPV